MLVEPTAHTSLAEIALPPARAELHSGIVGLGVIVQLFPSQCSISCPSPLPTAHTSFAETAETDVRMLNRWEEFGLGTCVHADPFQCSISVRCRLSGPSYWP